MARIAARGVVGGLSVLTGCVSRAPCEVRSAPNENCGIWTLQYVGEKPKAKELSNNFFNNLKD